MSVAPGLLVLHGNRAEALVEALAAWTARHPLAPLESEVFLVQSNGVAEWLKMALAERHGVCAATRVELPARFLWRAYRSQLGRAAVPQHSALDKQPLTWRLMARLPALLARPDPEGVYAPLARFVVAGDEALRYQLAQRLADLYDQYQVYRGDWLEAWAAGQDALPAWNGSGGAAPWPPDQRGQAALPPDQRGQAAWPPDQRGRAALPPDQRWQAALWRELLSDLGADELAAARPRLHRRFVAALEAGAAPEQPLPRRVMLFGMTHVPMQTLEALAALARRSQVLLAIPNPCRYHWADIIDGRESLRAARRRQPLRGGRDLAAVPLAQMHAHAHPLLAAWGRQGRDFMRQLDAFDDADAMRRAGLRVDLYDEDPGRTLLEQVQARVRDLVPLAEHEAQPVDAADRSIVFHIAAGAQREVEVLHDELLAMLASEPLQPRDIIVMVPEIETYAPAIRSVFGQYGRGDARRIPYAIADLRQRGANPLRRALEWLLQLPQQRCTLAELRALLEVPALAARFRIDAADLPQLVAWAEGVGVRWGLDAAQRGALELAACGDANSWRFGLRRMLLGYASGAGGRAWDGIEPYAEVGGIEAGLAGALAALLEALERWSALAATAATPAQWAERLQALLATFFDAADERDRWTLAACGDALREWLEACDAAHFDAPLALAVVREAWLARLDEPSLERRFRAGGVTFCTLLPMRAIPFEVVCLLGMNDGDYPRATMRSDFDLMGWPGQARPGDRSRRDDDRQLMLEALLSARRRFYVGWSGRSPRDHSVQPPSVLVAQLRDYLAAGWGDAVLPARTTEHPLQPFSRRYFERASALATQAREWRAMHLQAAAPEPAAPPPQAPDPAVPLTTARLARFLQSPVQAFLRDRLGVVLRDAELVADDEPLVLGGLDAHGVVERVLAAAAEGAAASDPAAAVDAALARERRSGTLP
ncbi:MAG: exodeoxyribonuclease V subunit gamma, partial [Burkholderiales bacterium]|nr:exodeoxyribonuclease V subunit gamma [Burkholderiales bacterium]